jgi:hypothetical protein
VERVDIEPLSRVTAVGNVLHQVGPAAEQPQLRDVPWGAAGESQEPEKREPEMPYEASRSRWASWFSSSDTRRRWTKA